MDNWYSFSNHIIASFSSEPFDSIESTESIQSIESMSSGEFDESLNSKLSPGGEIVKRHPPRHRLSKEKRTQLFLQGPFSEIKDSESLQLFLVQNPNVYNKKVLNLLERNKNEGGVFDEIHHIIPRSAGGPDDSWNLIPVSLMITKSFIIFATKHMENVLI